MIDYLAFKTGGPVYYTGRDMKLSHKGMGISEDDWMLFFAYAAETMKALHIPEAEQEEIVAFVNGLKLDIVEP